MCGIVGKINFASECAVDAGQIWRMAEAIRHRGPDDDGVWTGDGVGLGHRRLSIIDLSPSGRNPMCNEDGTVWIVFNGEIYNFLELRPRLEAAGHKFKSLTDTEVILHLYEEHGAACVEYLRGMFAFAIWDRRARQLLLARDRMGVKPLHYSVTASGLLFASEIKALLASGEISSAPDPAALHQFLLWQSVPSPATAFRAVRKLPPASTLTWRPGEEPQIRRYWDLDCSDPIKTEPGELSLQLKALVSESTRMRLVADVPVGIFLSGGLDSACVLAAARQENQDKLKTFSVTFGSKTFDESDYARLLARHFKTEHHEFHVTPKVLELLPEMAALFDEPFADVAAIPTYYLSRLTREHVTVALGGDGGDEALGGYQRYLALKVLGRLARVPGGKWLKQLRPLLPYASTERSRVRYLRELLGIVDRSPREQYRAVLVGMINEEQWKSLYSDGFRKSVGEADDQPFLAGWDDAHAPNDLARAMASDTLGYIPECLNVKVDICSMASGLEVRSPFLDHKLVEFCARIPTSLKIRGLNQKYLLKQAYKSDLPAEIVGRSKAGFSLPIADWFRGELRDLAHDTLLGPQSRIREWFDPVKIKMMLMEHATRKHNWHIQLWRLLVLEYWFAQTGLARLSESPVAEEIELNRSPAVATQP